jgi:hypothetical protein
MTAPQGQVGEDVGELLRLWAGVKLDQVDDLVAEAEQKVAAIPDIRLLRQLVGELVVTQHWQQAEIADLKAEVARLRLRLRGRRR